MQFCVDSQTIESLHGSPGQLGTFAGGSGRARKENVEAAGMPPELVTAGMTVKGLKAVEIDAIRDDANLQRVDIVR
jgi:hypothetical protein